MTVIIIARHVRSHSRADRVYNTVYGWVPRETRLASEVPRAKAQRIAAEFREALPDYDVWVLAPEEF